MSVLWNPKVNIMPVEGESASNPCCITFNKFFFFHRHHDYLLNGLARINPQYWVSWKQARKDALGDLKLATMLFLRRHPVRRHSLPVRFLLSRMVVAYHSPTQYSPGQSTHLIPSPRVSASRRMGCTSKGDTGSPSPPTPSDAGIPLATNEGDAE